MGLDIKEILDDLNPSKKVLKWMVIGLFSLLTGSFVYNGLKPDDINISNIEQQMQTLRISVVQLQLHNKNVISELSKIKHDIKSSNSDVVAYVDKRITFVVKNSDKNKQYVLDVLEMSKQTIIEETRTVRVDTVYEKVFQPVEAIQPVEIIEETPILDTTPAEINVVPKDTVVKKGFFKRIFNL